MDAFDLFAFLLRSVYAEAQEKDGYTAAGKEEKGGIASENRVSLPLATRHLGSEKNRDVTRSKRTLMY
jgi:hypothetical protein